LICACFKRMLASLRRVRAPRAALQHARGVASSTWAPDGRAISHFKPLDEREMKALCVTEYVMRDFASFGDRLAILDGTTGTERSFKDLIHDVDAVGAGLQREYGVQAGDAVALMSPNHADYFSCLHGSAKLGLTITPVNPSYTAYEVGQQLVSSMSKVIIAHPDCLEAARGAADVKVARTGEPCAVISIDHEIAELRTKTAELPPTPRDPSDTIFLPYSSGTTGLPKGVMLSHTNLVANIMQCYEIDTKFLGPSDVTISPLPLFHIYAFLVSLHAPLEIGTPLITMKRFDLELFCKLLEEHKATRLHIVPPVLLRLAKDPIVDKYDVSSAKVAISAAAPLGIDLEMAFKERTNCQVKQFWGMSELSPIGLGNSDDNIKSGTVGQAVSSTEVKIIDVESGEVLGVDQPGELLVRGPQVMKGYLNDPEKTATCLTEDGWLHTGDIATIDKDGFVTITDRMKELIKYKGFQIAPAELEAVLLTSEDVLDSCVIPVPDDEAGEVPRAYVVLQPNSKFTEQDVMDYVAERVTKYKRLTGGVKLVEAIPKTESGKLLRRKVIEMDQAQ